MMDSQEMPSVPEEQLENTAAVTEETTDNETAALPQTKAEIIARLKEIADSEEIAPKTELDLLKQTFYKLHKAEAAAARAAYLEAGGDAGSYLPAPDPDEEDFRTVMGLIKQKRAEQLAEQERQKAENLQKKLAIIDRLKAMAATPEEANQAFNEFKELQTQWKEIKNIPAEKANELWKNYQLYVEQFYDLLKLNSEFREYDFKKNLEIKTRLCETAEQLANEEDVIAAFQQLQALHQEYKETGPVAKELREEIWTRFKTASTVINKRHQQHFEAIKAQEEENLAKKTALCEQVESIRPEELTTFAAWDEATKRVIELQGTWKTIGFAPQKMNVRIFERFRAACDIFFSRKASFFRELKENLNENLAKKKALCEKAEALKESTEWKATSDALSQLQKEWKSIGAVPKKYSESLWQRFIAACDYFFEQKKQANASVHSEETENLAKKKGIIEQMRAIAEEMSIENAADRVRELAREWNETGHVPFKEKDKIYQEYRELADKLFKELNLSTARRRLTNFKNSLKVSVEKETTQLGRERERLLRAYEGMKNDIKTYENNLGFLSVNSKKGNSLVNEINKKVEKLKDELALLKEKIKAVEEEMKNE
ncbi:MAG: DUF349 domain-containing protein [Paraprevotella sp.]|nr:DUF349 domain-containing protein [Paraprevotella sp.]